MIVKELIELLKEFDKNEEVIFYCEDDYSETIIPIEDVDFINGKVVIYGNAENLQTL